MEFLSISSDENVAIALCTLILFDRHTVLIKLQKSINDHILVNQRIP